METENQNHDKKILRILALAVAVLVGFTFMMCVFGVGIWVGQKRAEFSFEWAENYHRNFGGPKKGIFGNFPEQDFTNAHGVSGQVLTIDGNNLIIKGQESMEKTVVVFPETIIMNNTQIAEFSDIAVGNSVVVIGSPDGSGQIKAKFIRILPSSIIMPMSYCGHKILR